MGFMSNRLKSATSPYLLQHADNPVDWWPWGDEAFAEARRRGLTPAGSRAPSFRAADPLSPFDCNP